jgi:riboflavin synthase
VNVEPPLRMGDPLGGHWVQGHVDTTVEVLEREDHAEHSVVAFSLPPAMAPFVVEKGSVALDGVSLTVTAVTDDRFRVWLIPHTLEVTTLGAARPGTRVNFEADVLAKYVGRALVAFAGQVETAADRAGS